MPSTSPPPLAKIIVVDATKNPKDPTCLLAPPSVAIVIVVLDVSNAISLSCCIISVCCDRLVSHCGCRGVVLLLVMVSG